MEDYRQELRDLRRQPRDGDYDGNDAYVYLDPDALDPDASPVDEVAPTLSGNEVDPVFPDDGALL